jgi:RNA polymerase primary sigma factor
MTQRSVVPSGMIEKINLLVRTRQQMSLQIGREPTPEELAEKLATTADKVRKLLDIATTPVRG